MLKRFVWVLLVCLFTTDLYGEDSYLVKSYQQYIVLSNKKSLEKQIIYENTVYELNEAIKIKSAIRIPENCTLFFTSNGRIEGTGCLIGNNTRIIANPIRILGKDIELSGSWNVENAYCEWFGGSPALDDNSEQIQECLDVFNIIKLTSGIYQVRKTIIVNNDKCLIMGVSRDNSEIRKIPTLKEAINAIIHIRSKNDKNLQRIVIKDIKLGSLGFNVDYGIYTEGVNTSEFRNLHIFQCRQGFYCCNETHGALWNLIFDNLEINSNTIRVYPGINHYGYKEGESCGITCITKGGAGLQFNKCWVRDCGVGFKLKGINYSQLNNCGADNIHTTAYKIEYCSLSINECGMENVVTDCAIHLLQSNVSILGLQDYKIMNRGQRKAFRIKVDGGNATLTNCFFSPWKVNINNEIFGVTADYKANVTMINTNQPSKVNVVEDALNGATIKYVN